jgi:hypothetical protein
MHRNFFTSSFAGATRCARPSAPDARREPLAVDVETEAVRELVPRVEKLAHELRSALSERREKR